MTPLTQIDLKKSVNCEVFLKEKENVTFAVSDPQERVNLSPSSSEMGKQKPFSPDDPGKPSLEQLERIFNELSNGVCTE